MLTGCERKHAYLIMAHKDDYTFRTLLHMLDDPRNDIFIHMDVKNRQFDRNDVIDSLSYSKCFFTRRTNVVWGGYSQINAELLLLALAVGENRYTYYHLLSGQDLPIKSQDFIHEFFEKNFGKEFMRFESDVFCYYERVRYYYFFQEKIGRGGKSKLYGGLNKLALTIQKILKVNRNSAMCFRKGDTWFSITDSLARSVLERKEWIRSVFKDTVCCDEVCFQTIVVNSEFKDSLYRPICDNSNGGMMRLIDWRRGRPYIFRKDDLRELEQSAMLWARKFDCEVDSEIIDIISEKYGQ